MEGAPAGGTQSRRGEGPRLPAELYSHSTPGHLQRGVVHAALFKRFPKDPLCTQFKILMV